MRRLAALLVALALTAPVKPGLAGAQPISVPRASVPGPAVVPAPIQTPGLAGPAFAPPSLMPVASPISRSLPRLQAPAAAPSEPRPAREAWPQALSRIVALLAREFSVEPGRVAALIERAGGEDVLRAATGDDPAVLEAALRRSLIAELEANKPPQARFLENLDSAMRIRSGDSIEEIARSGAYVYADFTGLRLKGLEISRNPDLARHDVRIYATREGDAYRFSIQAVFRPDSQGRPGRPFIESLKNWIREGVPAVQFAD